jgi:hypothetical protein
MENVMEYVLNAYVILTSVVTIASIVANYTDTPKDDVWVAKAYKLMESLAFLNGKAKQL